MDFQHEHCRHSHGHIKAGLCVYTDRGLALGREDMRGQNPEYGTTLTDCAHYGRDAGHVLVAWNDGTRYWIRAEMIRVVDPFSGTDWTA